VVEYLEDGGFTMPMQQPLSVNHTSCRYPDPRPPTLTQKELVNGTELAGRWYQVRTRYLLGEWPSKPQACGNHDGADGIETLLVIPLLQAFMWCR
jgi:hypothetical protein